MTRNPALLWVLLSVAAFAQTRPAWDGAFSATQADRGRAALGARGVPAALIAMTVE
jgi:hypothetical protein